MKNIFRSSCICFMMLIAPGASILASDSDFVSDLAGSWYPADKDKLAAEIAKYADVEAAELDGELRGLILPHAGYIYSGMTAMKALKLLKRQYGTILIIGPAHRHAMRDTISVPLLDSYSTPLGKCAVARDKAEKLISSSEIFKDLPEALKREHSVQMEVPLLQAGCGIQDGGYKIQDAGYRILFLIAGQLSPEKMKEAGEKIRQIWDEDSLLVVSTDFTHYGERFGYRPFKDKIAENVRKLDMQAFSFIERKDADGFQNFLRETGATICGAAPITVMLHAIGKDESIRLVDYSDSSRVTGDDSDRVSYISAAILSEKKKNKEDKSMFTNEEKRTLLSLARKTIIHYLENGKSPVVPEDMGEEISENLQKKRAAFVTLTINGSLRGCIGEILPSQPLYMSVVSNAANAAFDDPRFRPLTKDEFGRIHVEISVLSEPAKVDSYKDIVIGRDGMILSKGRSRALFLPQVAPEQGWTLEETLSHLSMKAGLPSDAWKSGCSFQTFQAEVFGEEED